MLQKDKERNEVEVMNSSIQFSTRVSELLIGLVSIGAKGTCLAAPKVDGKRGRGFQISHRLCLSSRSGNFNRFLLINAHHFPQNGVGEAFLG